jgi:hypothetical protein
VCVPRVTQGALLAMQHVGGKLQLFQHTPPNLGRGRVKARDGGAAASLYGTDREHTLRQPEDAFFKGFAAECSRQQARGFLCSWLFFFVFCVSSTASGPHGPVPLQYLSAAGFYMPQGQTDGVTPLHWALVSCCTIACSREMQGGCFKVIAGWRDCTHEHTMQVSVDVYGFNLSNMDLASLAAIPRFTCGDLMHYPGKPYLHFRSTGRYCAS